VLLQLIAGMRAAKEISSLWDFPWFRCFFHSFAAAGFIVRCAMGREFRLMNGDSVPGRDSDILD
jgi:hypothetical protein